MRNSVLDDGDRAALESAYREHGADLWRAVLAFAGGDRGIAEDAVAHAFVEAGPRIRRIRDVRAWVFSVAFREAAAELRRARATAPVDGASLSGPRAELMPGEEGLLEMVDLVRGLSPRQRASFVLRELMGYSTSEAASLLGASETAVRVHLLAARRRLRTLVEEAERA